MKIRLTLKSFHFAKTPVVMVSIKDKSSINFKTQYLRDSEIPTSQTHRNHFRPPQLTYSYSALEPICDAKQLKIHFLNFHLKSYEDFLEHINNSRAEQIGMLQIFNCEDEFSKQIVDSASIVYNHQLYWDNLSPYGGDISHNLRQAIENQFGSIFLMKMVLVQAGLSLNCCGWLWLLLDKNNHLCITTTKQNDNPHKKSAEKPGTPILAIDLWEHAYYPKFGTNKEAYLKTLMMMVNWKEVSNRYRFLT